MINAIEKAPISDYAKNEQLYTYYSYRGFTLSEIASGSYGDFRRVDFALKGEIPLIQPALLSGSDYSGGSVTQANYESFIKEYEEYESIAYWLASGGYGTYAIFIRADLPEDHPIVECLNDLSDYPVVDEEHLSEVESEREYDAYEGCYKNDFVYFIEENFNLEMIYSADIDTLFFDMMERANVYWQHETGDSVYIDLGAICKAVTLEDIQQYKTEPLE